MQKFLLGGDMGGRGVETCCNEPRASVLDSDGNNDYFIACSVNNYIRMYTVCMYAYIVGWKLHEE